MYACHRIISKMAESGGCEECSEGGNKDDIEIKKYLVGFEKNFK